MTVIMAFPHTHLTGVEVKTRLIRKGIDMGYVYYNKYYKFDYQQTYELEPAVVITPVIKKLEKFCHISFN
jgi:hypothetical protein